MFRVRAVIVLTREGHIALYTLLALGDLCRPRCGKRAIQRAQ